MRQPAANRTNAARDAATCWPQLQAQRRERLIGAASDAAVSRYYAAASAGADRGCRPRRGKPPGCGRMQTHQRGVAVVRRDIAGLGPVPVVAAGPRVRSPRLAGHSRLRFILAVMVASRRSLGVRRWLGAVRVDFSSVA
jgi:hypothetical protein